MSKSDTIPVQIINDDYDDMGVVIVSDGKSKITRKKIVKDPLKCFYSDNEKSIEIGVDEAGRGPLFGRVYVGAVVLPKDMSFDHWKMKDSKKFSSKIRIEEAADYIKQNAIAWAVAYEDETVIDSINILQATQSAMHKAIQEVRKQILKTNPLSDIHLLIDGNYFKSISIFNKETNKIETLRYTCIEGGDNKYTCIAAASILAKVERDKYIHQLCQENPELSTNYGIDTNKGYGAKQHMEGIAQHGITIWHRRSFGPCKKFA